jgi:hypothetical protein
MTPLRQLVTWVITQGGRVHRDDYHLLIRCCRGSRAAPAASPVMFIV